MTKLSQAQSVFMKEILKYERQEFLTLEELKNSLLDRGVAFEEEEIFSFFRSLQFDHTTNTDKVSTLEIYANAHLFRLDPERRQFSELMEKIAFSTGVGLTQEDMS